MYLWRQAGSVSNDVGYLEPALESSNRLVGKYVLVRAQPSPHIHLVRHLKGHLIGSL